MENVFNGYIVDERVCLSDWRSSEDKIIDQIPTVLEEEAPNYQLIQVILEGK
jgi:hypothetical protein